jgi:hypothetical protein
MSFFNTLTNNRVAKGVVGGALNVLPGYSTLGSNISNPNVNYQGKPNPTNPQIGFGSNDLFTTSQQGHVLGVTDTQPALTTGGGTGSADPQAEAARYGIEQGIQQSNDALGRLDNQYNVGLGNINGDYQSAYDQLTGQQATAKRDNQIAINNQLQDYQQTRDQNNQNARSLLMGARRLFGQYGAGGGSADLYGAPLAANQEANNANATVRQTNERNIGALTTAADDNEKKFQQQYADLTRQRDQGQRTLQSNFDTQRSDLLGTIAQLTGQQKIAQGGNYKDALAAARPYTSRIASLLDHIDSLSANVPAIRAQAVNLSTPDLAQYGLARYDAPTVAAPDPTLGANARMLLGLDDNQRRQQLV